MSNSESQYLRPLTPDAETVKALQEAGFLTIFDVCRHDERAFIEKTSILPAELAKQIHAHAKHRSQCILSLHRAYQARNEPLMRRIAKLGVAPSPETFNGALQRSLGGAPDFADLFPERSEDGYAEAESIQSLFSPGRYLTELYKVSKGLHTPSSPLNIDHRRPDIQSLTLSEANMTTEVSTLDILIDVLLAGIKQTDASVTMTSLETTYFPMTLPYHDNLVQIRSVLASKSSSLPQVWAILDDYQAQTFAPLPPAMPPSAPLTNVTTPSPMAREELLLAPATYQLLASAPADAARIRRDYRLANDAVIETALKPVPVFTEKTGLSFNQLVEMTGQANTAAATNAEQMVSRFFTFGEETAVPVTEFGQTYLATATNTAIPLLVVPSTTAGATAELNLSSSNAVLLADRAERLIRLQRVVNLEFHQLDWLIKNANLAYSASRIDSLMVDTPVLETVAEFQRLRDAYNVSADVFACFIGDMNTYAPEFKSSLYQQLFTSMVDNTSVPLSVTVNFTPEVADVNATLIAGGLGVSTNELFTMASLAFDTPASVTWSARAAAQLYRQAMIPRMLGITYYQARLLWRMLNPTRDLAVVVARAATLETLGIIRQTEAVLQWMSGHELDIDESFSLTSTHYSENVTPELYNFVDNIYSSLSADEVAMGYTGSAELSPAVRQKLFGLIAAVFKVKSNVMGRLIDWIDTSFETLPEGSSAAEAYDLGDFWMDIQTLFSGMSEPRGSIEALHEFPNAVRYSQGLAQYALIAQWANLTEQDLDLILLHPAWFMGESTVSAPDINVLLYISRLKQWQQRVLVPEAEAMSYFKYANQAGQTAPVALAMLARIHGWDLDTTSAMNLSLTASNVYQAFPTNFIQVLQLEAWMQVSLQTAVGSGGIEGLYHMSLENVTAEATALIQQVAEHFVATLPSVGKTTTNTHSSAPLAGEVSVSGTAMVGQTLTGSYVYISPEGIPQGTSTFKWYRSGGYGGAPGVIVGATAMTYLLTAADEGATLQFAVTPVASAGVPTTGHEQKSAPSAVIKAKSGSAPVASDVTVTGTRTVGQTLTGHYVYSDADGDAEGATSFGWWRGGGGEAINEEIPGATGRTYVLQEADADQLVRFVVTPKALTGTPKVGAEVMSPPGERIAPGPNSPPVITNLKIEKPTAARRSFEVFYDLSGNGTVTYQWWWRGSPIPSATQKIHHWISPVVAPASTYVEELSVVITPRSTEGVTGNAVTAKIGLKSTFNWGFMQPIWGPGTWPDVDHTCRNNAAVLPTTQELQSLVSALGNLQGYGVNPGANYWSSSNGTAANTKQAVRITDGAGFDSVPQSAMNAGIAKR